jgi:hypothetical protein
MTMQGTDAFQSGCKVDVDCAHRVMATMFYD